MQKIDVAGLKIDFLTKPELIESLKNRITSNQPTWVTTVYSEFLYAALKDPKVMAMLNKADVALPDGIGIFWAHKFLSIPLTAKSYLGKILQTLWQVKYSLFLTLMNPKYCSVPIHGRPESPINLPRTQIRDQHTTQNTERIPGSELIWDIAKMAEKNNLSIYLLGGYNDTPKLVSQKLQATLSLGREKVLPSLKIAGYSSKNPEDASILDDIKKMAPDILLVAFGPIKQEQWIYKHRDDLKSVKLFIGLGGTFDYIAGNRLSPPSFIREIGLEWLFRLITQPYRAKRIWNATFGLITMLVRYKVFHSYPLRKNVAAVILNKENKVLIGERNPKDFYIDIINSKERLKTKNYWQLPQGGVDAGESMEAAAMREATEETGLKNLQLVKISEKVYTYYWNNALRKLWKNRRHKNVGQKQSFVYFKFLGSDTEIKMDQKEFISYKWVSINELSTTVHPEREPMAKIIQADLKEMQEKAII